MSLLFTILSHLPLRLLTRIPFRVAIKAMLDYFVMGMASALVSFLGGILATNPHWSDFLTDLSFIILYVILAVCLTQVLWNSVRWSSKNPVSMCMAVMTVGVAVTIMGLMHKNQLFTEIVQHVRVMAPLTKEYLLNWFQPAAKVAHDAAQSAHIIA
ncbi:uncharacterized protein LOC129590568 [Paramacrobiotus metropolitanus]|uniref:uncharacterized protein LOC129590568 n=1 Tax=Paramacrobiotus metropolitanus TaxID=2943436 RepID=UPI002445F9B5|nr:uncharacterized protein LOC129590568 [Paramacrobiotus metropolitanus]